MGDLRARLEEALGTGELVRVAYAGGKTPGRVRDLMIVEIDADSVRAREADQSRAKSYRIDRLALVGFDAPLGGGSENAGLASLDDFVAGVAAELRGLGWHVVARAGRISLYRPGAAGKKHVALILEERHRDLYARPFLLRGPLVKPARSFADLDLAAATFLEIARRGPLG